MTDDLDLPAPPNTKKRVLILAGAGVGALCLLGGTATVLVVKVQKFHTAWCAKVGTFCVKEPPKPVVVVPLAGCPDFKIKGALTSREPKDPVDLILADVNGKVSLNRNGWVASGDSNVNCYKGQFLASFTGMSHGVTYQCVGSIQGKSYAGVCDLSAAGPRDVSGEFTN